MIIAFQGERGVFFRNGKSISLSHFSLETPHLWYTYKDPPPPPLSTHGFSAWRHSSVPDSSKRPAEAKHIGQFGANSWQMRWEKERRWLTLSLLVNWKPCRRARNLPEIPIDRGILQQVGAGQASRCPDRWLPSFTLQEGRAHGDQGLESEITAICTQESSEGRHVVRDGHQGERSPSWKNQC